MATTSVRGEQLPLAARARGLERTLIRQIFDSAPPGAINFGLGQPDLPTPELVREAGIQAIRAGHTGYTTTAGLTELRQAVALRYPGFAAGADSVVITVGSEEAVFLTYLALVEAGDEVLVPDPGYPAYPAIARLLGATPVPYRLRAERGFAVAAGDVEAALTPRTRLVVLNSPGNPTGGLDRAEDLERIAAIVAERGIAWLSDEIYANFIYEGPGEWLWTRSTRGVVVSGLSKDMCMAGWRLGWLVAEPALARAATALHQYAATCAPSITQHAALAALGPEGEAVRSQVIERFRRRRDRALAILQGCSRIEIEAPRGAFYLWARLAAGADSMAVCRTLMDKGVITIPGVAFGAAGEGWLRISLAASEPHIERGMAILREHFA